MKVTTFLITLFCSFSYTCFAQADLITILKETAALISSVETSDHNFEQTLTWEEDRPFSLSFESVRTGKKKGDVLTEKYVFNLADFDVNTVRAEPDKDKMLVILTTDNKRKTIKKFEEGEQQNYEAALEIIATDNSNGAEIVAQFKKAIPIGKKLSDAELNLNSFDARKNWLTENIIDFSINETSFEQSMEVVEDHPCLFRYSLFTRKGKSAEEESWLFNLADIRRQSVRLEVKSKEVFVELATNRNQKFIQHWKDGELDGYEKEVKILVPEVDIARHLVQVLNDLIPESEEAMKTHTPIPTTQDGVLQFLAKNIGDVTIGENQYEQNFEPTCVTTLTIKSTEKETVTETWTFNLADLNERTIEVAVKGKNLQIKAYTLDKKSMIQVTENEVPQNYDKEFMIYAKDVENAKVILAALEIAIKQCRENLKFEVPTGGESAQFGWLSEKISTVKVGDTDYVQKLEQVPDEKCTWQFTLITAEKESKEEVYQFSLGDLDPAAIDFKISKQDLAIAIETRYGEKVVKYFKDGEPEDYQKLFLIRAPSVEQGRNMIESFKRAMEGCK